MKIRNGFVSNSSSSSFIVCGYLLERNGETLKHLNEVFWKDGDEKPLTWKEMGRRILDLNWYYTDYVYGETNVPDDKVVIGDKLFTFSEEMKIFEYDRENFYRDVLEDEFGDPQIICGMEMC